MQTLKLLLPILIPSWRFFKEIAPSPRIEYRLLRSTTDEGLWQRLELRPKKLTILQTIKSLFFNPYWNEALFITNCAEQLIINYTEFGEQEIAKRIISILERRQLDLKSSPYLEFRIVFLSKHDSKLEENVLFTSEQRNIYSFSLRNKGVSHRF